MKSKSTKEFKIFGIVFNGFDTELYTLAFDPNDANPYHLYLVEALKPPNSLDLYSNTKETLEYLLSFKTSIIPSLAEEADIVKPCIYHSCIHLFKPSISFKND
ncbi:hypothetical protein BD560DRAFT_321979 [Blakeslea trispora]|nr:hypothetical protein BD560DRAFT_321979 [Blakeslea trispora]